jgi:hypothetical protein
MDVIFNALPPAKQLALLNGPAIPPPLGVKPNFEHPPNSKHIGWIFILLGLTLATISVCARLYSRAFLTKKVMIEDCKRGEEFEVEMNAHS